MSRRVLLVTDAYAPTIGGAERATASIAAELTERGHTVAVAAPWHRGEPARGTQAGIEVHRIRDISSRFPWLSANPNKHIPPPFPDPEAVLRLRALIRRFRPDVVHSYGWMSYSCDAAIGRSRIPLVITMHDYWGFCAVRTLLHRRHDPCSGPAPLKCLGCATHHYGAPKAIVAVGGAFGARRLARRIAGAQFNSAFMREVNWRHLLAGRARFAPGSAADAVIPPFGAAPIDGPVDPAVLARLPDAPFILFVGAFRRVKGVYELIDAYRRIPDAPPLVLAGTREIDSPPGYPAGVTVIESMPHAAVMAAWERALFGVFPSRGPEPFGMVVHEAMSRGRPAIGTVPGGHGELIADGVTGLLVPCGDVDALTGAMRRLIDDGALRERMGAAARERAAEVTAERLVPKLEELFDAAVAAAPAGGGR